MRLFAGAVYHVFACWTLMVAVSEPTRAALPAPPGQQRNVWKQFIVESPSTGKIERFWVGHRAALRSDQQHPVVYFLPGLLDDDGTWKGALDPHLASHDVIAVCPAVGGATWFMNSPRQPWMRWGDFLTEDLRGFVENRFPAARTKGQRGITGISAGGHAAFYHAITRTDLYGSVSVLSGAMDLRGYAGAAGLDFWIGPRSPDTLPLYAERSCVVLAGRQNGPLPFELYLDTGDKDGALSQMVALRQVLDARGAAYRWNVGSGIHAWTYWTARAGDHLAWHAEQFARNRRDGRFTDVAPPRGAELKVISAPPDVTLSDSARSFLVSPWTPTASLKTIAVTGLAASGTPLSKTDARYKEARFGGSLPASGHGPGVFACRLTLRVDVPLPHEGTITLTTAVRNGRTMGILTVPATLPVPAGQPQRRVELRTRIVIELKPPDPLRGGIVVAVQPFDAAGRPVGDPAIGKALAGTVAVERWTVAPQAMAEWTVTLAGQGAVALAAIQEARLEAEPAPDSH